MRPPYTTEQILIVETLQALMDRLSSPDLTAAEARDLRPRLFQLLETIEHEQDSPLASAGDRKAVRGSSRCLSV